MAGQVQDFETAITQINEFAIIKKRLGRRRLHFIARGLPITRRQSGEDVIADIIIGDRVETIWPRQDMCLGTVDGTIGKFVMVADMIEMAVTGYSQKRPLGN